MRHRLSPLSLDGSYIILLTVPGDRKTTNKVSVLRRPFNGIGKAIVVEKYLEKWQVCLLKGNLDPCVSSAVKVINDFGKAADSYHAGLTAPLVRDISLIIYFCCSVLQIESVRSWRLDHRATKPSWIQFACGHYEVNIWENGHK